MHSKAKRIKNFSMLYTGQIKKVSGNLGMFWLKWVTWNLQGSSRTGNVATYPTRLWQKWKTIRVQTVNGKMTFKAGLPGNWIFQLPIPYFYFRRSRTFVTSFFSSIKLLHFHFRVYIFWAKVSRSLKKSMFRPRAWIRV